MCDKGVMCVIGVWCVCDRGVVCMIRGVVTMCI